MPQTLYQKIVNAHTVKTIDANTVLLYCDIHFANEYTSPQAFAGLVERKINVLSPDSHLCVVDHIIPTHDESPRRMPLLFRRKRLRTIANGSALPPSMAQTAPRKASNTLSWKSKVWFVPAWS